MPSKKEDYGLYQTQIQTNVGFTGFMTAVVIFFNGLLLSQFKSFDVFIKIPISFLIISTFGFLYSTLIFANASQEVSQKNAKKLNKHLAIGDALSEYLGVYLLVLSIPLIINVVTQDFFLRAIALISSLSGLVIYQFSHCSILERYFRKSYKLISIGIIALGIILFFSQIFDFCFVPVSLISILILLTITFFAIAKSNHS